MKNINRYGCGNGEGMFDDKEGYWVTHEDYKQLLDKYEKLALTIPVVSNCTACNDEINYKGVCEICYTELKLNDLD